MSHYHTLKASLPCYAALWLGARLLQRRVRNGGYA